jgi:hypothetical protein
MLLDVKTSQLTGETLSFGEFRIVLSDAKILGKD